MHSHSGGNALDGLISWQRMTSKLCWPLRSLHTYSYQPFTVLRHPISIPLVREASQPAEHSTSVVFRVHKYPPCTSSLFQTSSKHHPPHFFLELWQQAPSIVLVYLRYIANWYTSQAICKHQLIKSRGKSIKHPLQHPTHAPAELQSNLSLPKSIT